MSVQPGIAHLFAPITPQHLHWDTQSVVTCEETAITGSFLVS